MNKKVLLVEDEYPITKLVTRLLERNGFEVTATRNADQAVETLLSSDFDAVWLDHYLSGEEDGIDFVESLREYEQYEELPIFVVSNTVGMDKIGEYVRLKVTRYYQKNENKLSHIVEDLELLLT